MITGIGIDIIEIDRIEAAIKKHGQAFLTKILTAEEITYCKKFKSPYPHYAGLFAVKEAIYKAMENPKLAWHDVSILNDAHGKPVCHFRDKKLKKRISVSISHSKNYAVAQAIVEA